MQDLIQKILQEQAKKFYINRATHAAAANIAVRAVETGRSAVLAAPDRDSLQVLSALAKLYSGGENKNNSHIPFWERKVQLLRPIQKFDAPALWSAHISALYALSLANPVCFVCSLQSFLFKYMSRDFFKANTLHLAPGQDISLEMLTDQLFEWGYERTGLVSRHGEVAVRGDIFDVYAPGYEKPIRIEFFGDTVEEIRLFDAETQQSVISLDQLTLLPISPFLYDKSSLSKSVENLQKLASAGKADENDVYTIRKEIEQRKPLPFPVLPTENSSYLEEWLNPQSLWIVPGERESIEALDQEKLKIKENFEKNHFYSPLFASRLLRKNSSPAPWNNFQHAINEPLALGAAPAGISLPEKDISFTEQIFPEKDYKDRPWQTLSKSLQKWNKEKNQTILSFASERSRKKFLKIAEQDGIFPDLEYGAGKKGIFALVSPYSKGADIAWNNSLILGEDILFPKAQKGVRSSVKGFKGLDRFDEIKIGDFLVHKDYGIGKYAGLHHLEINNAANDYILLEYANDDKLYVPADRLNLVQRFKGGEGVIPVLDKLGGAAWQLGKEKAKKAIEKIAADLVEMYAYRKVVKGFHYNPPDELYREFEASFNFEETPDQDRAINEVLADMEKREPMDRLVCGDVGFGKTEVALRAAFRAASEGRQAALLCPTTVLAEQHYQTFRARLAGFPINVGLLSRFVPKATQKDVLEKCASGTIDILIGTHRLLSKDVHLPNLALLILDEEQRFGVRHKEKLKEIKKNVDVLTLTATPIPRTLQLSMSGIRDLSLIETPPADRKPVASAVIDRDAATLAQIIRREMERGGQVFWVYNRVHGLDEVYAYIQKLAPDARIGVAHGQMAESELEKTMRKFWHGEYDVLLSTSIIESGLDFPKANTLVVDQAQMFGLSQLYQLRGRVGRSDRQAYAYFIVPDNKKLSDLARERLRIILEMDYLGAGFQIAMEDLRLRGAGNILGEAQTGHMTRIGLDLYLEMLEEEVKRLKGVPEIMKVEPELSLGIAAHIPESYIADGQERLKYYKLLTSARESREREEIALGIKDRYGSLPEEMSNFLSVLDFKLFLSTHEIGKADIGPDCVKLFWADNQTVFDPRKILDLAAKDEKITLAPPKGLIFKFADDISFAENLKKIQEALDAICEPAPVAVQS